MHCAEQAIAKEASKADKDSVTEHDAILAPHPSQNQEHNQHAAKTYGNPKISRTITTHPHKTEKQHAWDIGVSDRFEIRGKRVPLLCI